jgi:hypothetical protein
MIPTRFKSKLPKTLSYPLGATTISDALANAPHFDDFTLLFYDAPIWPASEFQRLLRESLPYKVFAVSYEPALKINYGGSNYLGHFDVKRWELLIYPVLRHLRQKAGQMLREEGLPAVVEWLRSANQTGWESRQHSLALVFCPGEETLVVQREDGP